MKCIVCKVTKEKGEGRGRWMFSSERVPMSKIQITFKLFDLTKKEFSPGSICPACFDLVVQIDSFEFQISEILKALKSRINCCASSEDYIATHANEEDFNYLDDDLRDIDDREHDDEDGICENCSSSSQGDNKFRGERKKRGLLSPRDSMSRTRVKREKPDYSEYKENNLEDDGDEYDGPAHMDINHYLSVEHIKKEKDATANGSVSQNSSKSCQPSSSSALPNKRPENLDFNVTVTRTTRGHDQLVYDNYTYLKATQQTTGDIAKWKCTSYYSTKTGCKAKLHTTMDGLCVLLDSKTEHNHPPPDERQLKIILFREQVKQIANNHPEMKPTEILSNAQMLLDTPTSLGLKDESIMRYIQRIKSKNKMEKQQQMQQQQEEQGHEDRHHHTSKPEGSSETIPQPGLIAMQSNSTGTL